MENAIRQRRHMARNEIFMQETRFLLTSRAVSVEADCTPQYVGQLALQGLVPHLVASDGTRLFSEEAASIVRKIKTERLARRGWNHVT
jgi:hypothetical protein